MTPSSDGSSPKRILIVDDHAMMREGLAELIGREPDLSIIGEAGNAYEALEMITAKSPDIVLTDVTLPGKSGIELIKDILARSPEQLILAFSVHDEAVYAERVLRAGARGYIMKQEGGRRLMTAIRRVLEGDVYVSERVSAKILALFSGKRSEVSPVERLTDRELDVFQLMGQGKTTAAIAKQLHLSPKTIEVHRTHIREKLQMTSSAEVISFAARWIEIHGST